MFFKTHCDKLVHCIGLHFKSINVVVKFIDISTGVHAYGLTATETHDCKTKLLFGQIGHFFVESCMKSVHRTSSLSKH